MDAGTLIAGGAVGGIAMGWLSSAWTKIKEFLWKFIGLFVEKIEFNGETTCDFVINSLCKNYKHSMFYDKTYNVYYLNIKDFQTMGHIPLEVLGTKPLVFWNGWIPIFYYCNSTESNRNQVEPSNIPNNMKSVESNKNVSCSIYFLRWSFNVDKLLINSCIETNEIRWNNNKEKVKRFKIVYLGGNDEKIAKVVDQGVVGTPNFLPWHKLHNYRVLHYKDDLDITNKQDKSLDYLIFPKEVEQNILEIKRWKDSEQWYKEKHIPWKRGWCLYGIPGSGKTALTKAFAEDLDLPIIVLNLAEMTNKTLKRAYEEIQYHTPCIVLYEDIDAVFHGRENITTKQLDYDNLTPERGSRDVKIYEKVTFDCLLNCIDGVKNNHGIFTIITTNHIEHIDPALCQPSKSNGNFIGTRPGRIDKVIELTYMTQENKKKFAKRILGEYPDIYNEMCIWIDEHPDHKETPAQCQEKYCQIALAEYWKLKELKDNIINETIKVEPPKDPTIDELSSSAKACISWLNHTDSFGKTGINNADNRALNEILSKLPPPAKFQNKGNTK